MFDLILENLENTGYALVIFLCAYLSNMLFGIWQSVKIFQQPFDKWKILNSVLKILMFTVGLALLITAVTTLPLFADKIGWAIPPEYSEAFSALVIMGAVLMVAIKYIKEAYNKLVSILNT